ncbi:hypothetical protein PsYK624_136610 [Phanerochaete sordida]|uniref:Uncharacterized protein n=1 Tax=Phanerochaete sordida TaxID=48140 RepID=A0A9P3GLC8_9APHY|nr:hypothetical protein PsYK624_136610 [Phanerochaete sordida]
MESTAASTPASYRRKLGRSSSRQRYLIRDFGGRTVHRPDCRAPPWRAPQDRSAITDELPVV